MKASLPPEAVSGFKVTIPPAQFNRIRLAQLRLGSPLRVMLGTRGLEYHLRQDEWLCFDRRLGPRPAIAWTDFPVGRRDLNSAVSARLVLYDAYARLHVHTALSQLVARLDERLKTSGPSSATVLSFHR
jgi:hypothetical protein